MTGDGGVASKGERECEATFRKRVDPPSTAAQVVWARTSMSMGSGSVESRLSVGTRENRWNC